MAIKYAKTLNTSQLEFLLVMMLILISGLGMLGIVTLGANHYFKTVHHLEEQFNVYNSLNYIGMKIRQNQSPSNIHMVIKDNKQILVITEEIEEVVYETWIYQYEDKLYELFTEKGNAIDLKNGVALMPIKKLVMEKSDEEVVKIQITNQEGESRALFLYLRGENNEEN